MENQSITAVFEDAAKAESAIGRLEVAGIPPENIMVDVVDVDSRTTVTASVEPRLVEKATGILAGEGSIQGETGEYETDDDDVENAQAASKDVE